MKRKTTAWISYKSKQFVIHLIKRKFKPVVTKTWNEPKRAKTSRNHSQRLPLSPADLVKFTEEILNGKLHFLCSYCYIFEGAYCKYDIKQSKHILSLTILTFSQEKWMRISRFWNDIKKVPTCDVHNSRNNQHGCNQYDNFAELSK